MLLEALGTGFFALLETALNAITRPWCKNASEKIHVLPKNTFSALKISNRQNVKSAKT